MKILIINSILYTSETNDIPKVDSIKDTMIYALCLGFLQTGHTPVLIAAEDYRPTEQEDYAFEVVFLPCRWKKIFPPRCLPWMPSLSSYLRSHQGEFDLIITSEVFSLCSFSAVRIAKEKTVVWHELGKHNRILKKLPSKLWYNIVGRSVFYNALIVPRSQAAYDFISKYCKNIRNTYVDHGVDLSQFKCRPFKKNQFIVVSQLIERKRIDGILSRFSDFLKQYQLDFKLYIIGKGTEEQNLKAQVKALGLENNVFFEGHKTHKDLIGALSESMALLVNTARDNSMVSIVEAIASGTPILTNSVPYNSPYIEQNELGIVKDSWTCNDMAEIVRNNASYVKNCIRYREKLGNAYCAEQFLTLAGLNNR